MKPLRVLFLTTILLAGAGITRAEFIAETSLRYARMQTDMGTQDMALPSIEILRTIDEQKRHALGLCLVSYEWRDSAVHQFGFVMPTASPILSIVPIEYWELHVIENLEVRERRTAVMASYRFESIRTHACSLFAAARAGINVGNRREHVHQMGGIVGIGDYTISYHESPALCAEVEIGALWHLTPHWEASFGLLYARLEAHSNQSTSIPSCGSGSRAWHSSLSEEHRRPGCASSPGMWPSTGFERGSVTL